MQEDHNLRCKSHSVQCMLFGASPTCKENSITCENLECMKIHSMRSHEHNFYSPGDFNRMTAQLHQDYSKTVAAYKQNVDDIIKKAISQLQAYEMRLFQQIEMSCRRIFSKNAEQSQAIAKVLKREFNELTCEEVALLHERHFYQKKCLDYTAFQQVQMIVQTASVQICNNSNVFTFQDMRYSSAGEKRQSDQQVLSQLKKRAYISPQDVENENVNLSLTIWDKISIQQQQDVHKAVKQINWQVDEWDLSEGDFENLNKIIEVSLMVNSKNLASLKLFSNGLTNIKPLAKCRFNNLTHLYISANQIVSLEDLQLTSFPKLKRLSAYDNHICSIRTLTKINYLRLKYLFLTNNHINEFHDLRLCTFPHLSQLSLNSNPTCELENITSLDIPKLYYLNIKNKQTVSGHDGKYMFEQRLIKKFAFVLL